MPQKAAGVRRLPPWSEPVASGTMPQASATAEPPDEPPQPLPMMEAHKLDPNTGEDEFARASLSEATYAQASLAPAMSAAERNPNDPASWGKVGRNEDCPCGSGKKYKHCHGRYA